MCGLFGLYSSIITTTEKDLFRQLGIVSSLRGTDSTGAIIGRRKKKGGNKFSIDIKKDVMNPTAFFEDWAVNKSINEDNVFLLAGHCRETTAGAINFHNAHPIIEDDTILCHNGTINKWKPSKAEEEKSSDSRIFARKISSLGIDRALREAEEGDYAITYVDRKTKTFNIARKPGRTLYAIFSKDGEVLMWASEAEFLELVLKRNGVRHNWSKTELFHPYELYTWKFADKPDEGSSRTITLDGQKKADPTPFDLTKYATAIKSDDPTKDDSAAYAAWMEKNGKSEEDWAPWSMTEDEFEEIKNDPPAETLSRETSSQDRTQSAQGHKLLGPPAPQRAESDTGKYYCKKCFERAAYCDCTSPQLYSPHAWELDSKGRVLNRTKEGSGKEASVPSVGRPTASGASDLRSLTKSKAEHDPLLENFVRQWDKYDDNSTYIGYLKQTMSPSVATEKLKAGCSICGHQSSWKCTTYWYSDWGHVCFDCKDKTIQFLGNLSTYKSRYVEGEVHATKH